MVSTMPAIDERVALMALLRSGPPRAWSELTDRVLACGSAYEVLVERDSGGQGELFATRPDPSEAITAAAAFLRGWSRRSVKLLTILDPRYPAALRTVYQRPPFLFYRGDLDRLHMRCVAVLGTQKASDKELRRAGDIAAGLADLGVAVACGVAPGSDIAVHRAVRKAQGHSLAVLGTGVQRVYPAESAPLQAELARTQLIASQYWPDAPPSHTSYPKRDAVLCGFAAATVVVEAEWGGDARNQGRVALQHGRPLLLHESLLAYDWGRQYAALPGTTIVSGADDALSQLTARLALEPKDQ